MVLPIRPLPVISSGGGHALIAWHVPDGTIRQAAARCRV